MTKTILNGYEIYTAVGSPLSARQFVNLFAGKALGPIARTVGLVPTGVSKRVLKGLILKKLVDLKVPEPIRRKVATKRTRDQAVATNQSLATANTNANRTNQPPANGNTNRTNQPPANGNQVKLNEPELNFRPNGTAEFLNRETVRNKTFVVPEGATTKTFPIIARGNSAQNFEAQNLGKHRGLSFSAATARMGNGVGNRNGINFRIPNMNFPTFGSPKKNLKIPINFEKMLKQFNVPEPPQLIEARRELEQTRAAAGPQNPMTQELEVKVREMEKSQLPKATGAGAGAGNTTQMQMVSGNGNRPVSQVPRGNGNRPVSQVPRGNGNRPVSQVPRGNGNRPVSQVSGNGNALQKVKNEANAERRRIEANAARARANLEANARRVQNNLKAQLSGAKNANKEREIQARLEKNRINLETKKAELAARTERNKAALAARVAERQANVNLRKAELAARAASASGRSASGPGLWNKVRNLVKKKPGTAAPVTREMVVKILTEAGAPRAQINEVRTSGNLSQVVERLAQSEEARVNSSAQGGDVPQQNGKQRKIRNVGEIRVPMGLKDAITHNEFEKNQPVYRVKHGKLYSYYGVESLNTWLKKENRPVQPGENITNMEKGRAVLVNLKNFGNVANKQLQERLMSLVPYIYKNGVRFALQRHSGGQRLPITNMELFKKSMGTNKHYEELVTFLKSTNSVTNQRVKKLFENLGLRRGALAPVSGNNVKPEPPSTNEVVPVLDENKVYIVQTPSTKKEEYYILKNGKLHEVSRVKGSMYVFKNGNIFLEIHGGISNMYGNKLNAIHRLTGNTNKNYFEGTFTKFESGDALARKIVDSFLANRSKPGEYSYYSYYRNFVSQHFENKANMKYKNFVRLVPHKSKAEFVYIQQKLRNAGVSNNKINSLKEASSQKAIIEKRVALNVFRENAEQFLENRKSGKKLNEAAGAQLKARINMVKKKLRNAGFTKTNVDATATTINELERSTSEKIKRSKVLLSNLYTKFKEKLAAVPNNKRKELMNEFNRMRTNNTTDQGLGFAYNTVLAKVEKLRARTSLQRLANGEFSNEAYARVHALLLANHPDVIERFNTQIEKQGGQELPNNMKQRYFTNAHKSLARSLRNYAGMSQRNLNVVHALKEKERAAQESVQRRLKNKKIQNKINSSKGAQSTLNVKLKINTADTVAALNTLKEAAYERKLKQYFNKKRAVLFEKEKLENLKRRRYEREQTAASVAEYKQRIRVAKNINSIEQLKTSSTYTGDAKTNINTYANAVIRKMVAKGIDNANTVEKLEELRGHANKHGLKENFSTKRETFNVVSDLPKIVSRERPARPTSGPNTRNSVVNKKAADRAAFIKLIQGTISAFIKEHPESGLNLTYNNKSPLHRLESIRKSIRNYRQQMNKKASQQKEAETILADKRSSVLKKEKEEIDEAYKKFITDTALVKLISNQNLNKREDLLKSVVHGFLPYAPLATRMILLRKIQWYIHAPNQPNTNNKLPNFHANYLLYKGNSTKEPKPEVNGPNYNNLNNVGYKWSNHGNKVRLMKEAQNRINEEHKEARLKLWADLVNAKVTTFIETHTHADPIKIRAYLIRKYTGNANLNNKNKMSAHLESIPVSAKTFVKSSGYGQAATLNKKVAAWRIERNALPIPNTTPVQRKQRSKVNAKKSELRAKAKKDGRQANFPNLGK
jgi:hypothetical protein